MPKERAFQGRWPADTNMREQNIFRETSLGHRQTNQRRNTGQIAKLLPFFFRKNKSIESRSQLGNFVPELFGNAVTKIARPQFWKGETAGGDNETLCMIALAASRLHYEQIIFFLHRRDFDFSFKHCIFT